MATEFGIRIKADASGFKGQVGEAQGAVEDFGKSADDASIAIASKLGVAVGAAAVAVGTYFVSQVRAGISALDDLDETAQGLGIAAEKLSSLQTTFRAGGVSAQQFTSAMARLNDRLADAAAGNAKAVALFDSMGISVFDATDKVKAGDVALGEIANKFRLYEDDVLQANLASDLFGRTIGVKMIPTLNKGVEGLTELTGANQEEIKAAAELQGEIDKLAASWDRLWLSVSGRVARAINSVSDKGTIEQQIAEVQQLIRSMEFSQVGDPRNLERYKAELEQLIAKQAAMIGPPAQLAQAPNPAEEERKRRQAELDDKRRAAAAAADASRAAADAEREEIRLAKELQQIRAQGYQQAIRDAEQRERELALLEAENQKIRDQIAEFGKTEVEVADLRAARLDEAAATKEQALARLELVDGNEAEIVQLREQIRLLRERAQLTRAAGGQAGLARTEREASESAAAQARAIADENAQMVDELRRGLTDAFMRGFEGGKGAARNFFDTVGNMIQTMILRRLAEGLINQVFGFFGLAAGSGAGNINAGGVSQPVFANGGVMTSAGPLPLARYARGGVADRPQVALFGEGSMNEAYVPLPDGRSIPVNMRGGGVTVNVINNAGAQVTTRERDDNGALTVEVIVDQVEQAIAGNVMRGRGALGGAIAGRFGLRQQPR